MTTQRLAIVVAAACLRRRYAGSPAGNLKPFDPAALQATVEATGKELLLPGAMVLLRTPQGDFAFGYGATELGGTTPPRGDTHFRIASNTKTMTAAAIMLLAQEGKLRFDDPVSKYVEGVPNGDNITISELLKMRSGLYNYTSAPELAESLDHDPARAWTPQEVLAIAFKHPPQFAPGHGIRTIATPITPCSVSSSKSLKARRWPSFSGSFVRTARHEAHIAPCQHVEHDP